MARAVSRPYKPHVKVGDVVVALSGADAVKGKTGKVLRVFPAQQRAIVEGFNQVKKTLRKSQDQPQGGIIDKEAAIHLSNLRLADAAEGKSASRKKAAKPAKKSAKKDR
jgi:large subunit ribosomal protein L24